MKDYPDLWAKALTGKLLQLGLPREDQVVYHYALISLLHTLIGLILLLAAALLTHSLPAFLWFCLGYFPCRTFWGGFHVNRSDLCLLISLIMEILILQGIPLLAAASPWIYPTLLFSALIVWLCAPVESKNKPLTPDRRATCRF